MMPELGKYTFVVLGSYAATFVLVLLLVGSSVLAWRRAKAGLDEIETKKTGSDE